MINEISSKSFENIDNKNQFNPDKKMDINERTDIAAKPKEYSLDARIESYKDDNGKEYRVGDNLIPNNQYEINGYSYKTDNMGRIVSAEGTLHLKKHEGRLPIKDSLETIAHGEQRENDERGHLMGDQLDGSNGMENITAQDSKENQGVYKKLEDQLANEIKQGKEVKYRIDIHYDEKSYIPTDRVYHYSIDGEKHMQVFPNGGVK